MNTQINKELEPLSQEKQVTIEDLSHPPEIHEEVKPWIEKVDEDVSLPKQVSDVGVTQAGPTTHVFGQKTIILPLTDVEEEKAFHQKINEAIRWLAVWCLRQAKIAHAKIRGFNTRT